MFDLLKFNNVNLDPLTETYNMAFYTQYLAKWPEYCFNVTAAQGRPMGYILGKAEGLDEEWHGHVTAVTVPPEYRRLGVAAQLMEMLERGSENARGCLVDLSNPNPSRNPRPLTLILTPALAFTLTLAPTLALAIALTLTLGTSSTSSCASRTAWRSACTRSSATPSTGRSSATTVARRTRSTCAKVRVRVRP